MSNKRYFWLKLQSNFFDRDDVKLVENMDNGKDYVIFYMKLILKSINSGGELRFKETIPYNEKMLSHLTNTNIDIVRSALMIFIELGMMERWDDGTLFMNETSNMIGSETSVAQRVRKSRANKLEDANQAEKPKLLQCNSSETKSNTEIEKDIDIDLEIDLNKETDDKRIVDVSSKPNKPQSKIADRFDEWWNLYPKKMGKANAKKTWSKDKLDLIADEVIRDTIERTERQYKNTPKDFIPYGSTYLSKRVYEDEIEDKSPQRKARDISGMDYGENTDEDFELKI